jgi:hypothetical protein
VGGGRPDGAAGALGPDDGRLAEQHRSLRRVDAAVGLSTVRREQRTASIPAARR